MSVTNLIGSSIVRWPCLNNLILYNLDFGYNKGLCETHCLCDNLINACYLAIWKSATVIFQKHWTVLISRFTYKIKFQLDFT